MSRAGLADAVNAHVWKSSGSPSCLDADTIGRYERGVIRWPRADYRAGLREVMGVESDSDLGFHPTPRGRGALSTPSVGSKISDERNASSEEIDPVDRRDFLRTLAATGAGVGLAASLEALSLELDRRAPTAISEADIAHLESVATFLMSWSHIHGGQKMAPTVSAEISRAATLLDVSCPPRLRSRLFAAVAHLGVSGGTILFDAHDHGLSEKILSFATVCAEEAGDWHLRAKALSMRARQAVWVGDDDAGFTLAQLGLVRNDRLTATETAMLHTATARAHGRLGNIAETIRAVGAADDAYAAADRANEVPWMAYYDDAQHNGDTGHALFELAVHGMQAEEATQRLASAVKGHTDAYIRSRSFSGFKLATLTMHLGEAERAVTIANAAISDAEGIRSPRLRRTALEIQPLAAAHQRDEPVADMLGSLQKVSSAA
jgi:hypothetical protein